MSWTIDGTLDPDEALRLLDHMSGDSDNDFAMLIENKGAVVEGESTREYEDGKQRMDIAGYAYLAERLLTVVNGAAPSAATACSQMNLVPGL